MQVSADFVQDNADVNRQLSGQSGTGAPIAEAPVH